MTSVVIEESLMVGSLEAPAVTLLGSLDDGQGANGIVLDGASPKPVLAIIYNGNM
ncbi:hypothetical protein [Streptomyces justiciae]|uniref:Uncharacterized protein n=1 Tax=Streptomyces justiciae TaxID=2780140 RepID=A0ABU3LVZ2_9ACTN|nr:hypothetical protein [Streptomyces justiciae]MDT7843399.1 hypothetical protein [Streptomyces justiciae]